jgi:cytochrome c-type biogenesis protein CcmH
MGILVILIFASLALAAASFAVLPSLRARVAEPRRWLLPVLTGLAVLTGGLGIYAVIGQPFLAMQALQPAPTVESARQDYPALISQLARIMRDRPNDPQGWIFLGQGYLAFGQSELSVRAFQRAVALTRAQGEVPPELLSDYGVALSMQGGEVTPQAEEAFREALSIDPRNLDARYHLGMAHAQRGEVDQAIAFWEPLVAEAGPDLPWKEAMFTQLAILKTRRGDAPNPAEMVARLQARLEADPKNLDGWLMLIRSYGQLGEPEKAHQAWVAARTAFAGDAQALAALEARRREVEVETPVQ